MCWSWKFQSFWSISSSGFTSFSAVCVYPTCSGTSWTWKFASWLVLPKLSFAAVGSVVLQWPAGHREQKSDYLFWRKTRQISAHPIIPLLENPGEGDGRMQFDVCSKSPFQGGIKLTEELWPMLLCDLASISLSLSICNDLGVEWMFSTPSPSPCSPWWVGWLSVEVGRSAAPLVRSISLLFRKRELDSQSSTGLWVEILK